MSEDTSGATPAAGASPTTSAASSAATPSSVPGPTTDPAGVRASLSYMTPEEERKWSGKGAPPPTGTSSAPPEGAHKVAEYRVTSLAPSMEKTGGHPVPYNIWAKADDDLLYSPNVNYRGTPAMRLSSRISTNYGDEAADPAGGVASNAKQGMAAPITSSSIVRINGSWAIRHGDRFEMDKASVEGPANTIGEGRLTRDTQPRAAPKDERSWWRQATDAVGQWVAEHPRTMGAVQAVGGVGEAIGSAALITGGTAADATGAGAVVGVPAQALGWAGLVNSADNISTGLRQLWYGAPQQTAGQQMAGAAAHALGASPETVQSVEQAAGMGQAVLGGVAGMGGAISRAGRAASKAEQAAEVGEKGVRVTRKISLREKYLGRTPGKNSRTGREVIKRMEEEGKIRTDPETGVTEFRDSTGQWRDLSEADMAHRTDAVTWWNETGRAYGAQAPEVRQWMLDPNNYYLEYNSINRSQGAILGQSQNYLPPLR